MSITHITAADLKIGDYILSDNVHGLVGIKSIVEITPLRWNRIRFKMRHHVETLQRKRTALFIFSLRVHQPIYLINKGCTMTYRELRDHIDEMSEEEVDQTVTVQMRDQGEFHPVDDVDRIDDHDVLDDGHVVLVV